jgi:hypothetical protein
MISKTRGSRGTYATHIIKKTLWLKKMGEIVNTENIRLYHMVVHNSKSVRVSGLPQVTHVFHDSFCVKAYQDLTLVSDCKSPHSPEDYCNQIWITSNIYTGISISLIVIIKLMHECKKLFKNMGILHIQYCVGQKLACMFGMYCM